MGEPAKASPNAVADVNEPLPEGLIDLTERAERLFERIAHLDRRLYIEAAPREDAHPVLSQFDMLKAAFGA